MIKLLTCTGRPKLETGPGEDYFSGYARMLLFDTGRCDATYTKIYTNIPFLFYFWKVHANMTILC